MKKVFFVLIFSGLILSFAAAQQTAAQPAAELTFTFTRQGGAASNQFAIWIENAQGQYIKTIYAARYTADGGWRPRKTSLPTWVRKSDVASMTKPQVDALTAATPRSGNLSYTWDGTNSSGAAVPAGNYVIYLEGTLRWTDQVVYSAPIRLGQGPASPEVNVEYTGNAEPAARAMISNVRVRTLR